MIIVGIAVGVFNLAVGTPTSVATKQSVVQSDLTPENLLREVNEERVKAGVTPLAINPLLNQSAQAKADEIESTGVYSHTGVTGKHGYEYIREMKLGCLASSENLAADTTAQGAINDWLVSKPHKDAMLDAQYDSVGFGVSDGIGYQYIVQHFCNLP